MLSYQTTIPVTSEIYEGPAHIAEIECKAEVEFDLEDRSLIFEVAALHFDGAALKPGHVLFEPIVKGIHAGLECGLFSERYPNLDMVSFGPTLRGVHTPDERLLIPTVQMVWDHLLDIMKNLK